MSMDLAEMKKVDLRTVDKASLTDRREVHIDPAMPVEQRVREWIEQLRNPYIYLDGGIVVKLSFSDGGASIEDRINSLYLSGV